MQTWLVTGGAGFIGGNFVLDLVGAGEHRMINLDALTYAGNRDTLAPLERSPHHKFIAGDIADRELVTQLLTQYQPSAVINFAAESHVDRSIDGPAEFIQTNVVGTMNLLQATLGYWRDLPEPEKSAFRFLHVSTDEVYGSLGDSGAFREDTPYAPTSGAYAAKRLFGTCE